MLGLGDPTEADLAGLLFQRQWVAAHGARRGAVSARVGPYPGRFQGVRCFSGLEKAELVSSADISAKRPSLCEMF